MSYMSGRWLMKKKILIAVLGIAFSNVTIGTAGKDMPAGRYFFCTGKVACKIYTIFFR